MAVRTDITIDYSSSPRVIALPRAVTAITVQDLADTLEYLYAFNANEPKTHTILPTVGALVGITLLLHNTVLEFQGHVGPDPTQCVVQGGQLVAETGLPISPTSNTQVILYQAFNIADDGNQLTLQKYIQLSAAKGIAIPQVNPTDTIYADASGGTYTDAGGDSYTIRGVS